MFRFQVLAVILREFLINTCFSIVDLDVKIVQCIEGGCRNGECDKLTGEVELKLGIWYIGQSKGIVPSGVSANVCADTVSSKRTVIKILYFIFIFWTYIRAI